MEEDKVRIHKVSRGARKAASASVAAALALGMMGVPCVVDAYAEHDAAEMALADESAMPDFKGSNVVARYLEGQTPTLDELASVDLVAVRDWDAALADELTALRESLGAESEDSEESDAETPGSEGDASIVDSDIHPGESPETALAIDPSMVADEVSVNEDPFDATQIYPEWSYEGDTSFTMIHYTQDMDAQKLIAAIGEPARQVAQDYDVSASEMIALAVVSSNSGTSVAAQAPMRNLFRTPGDDGLASYESYGDCLEDHASRVAAGIEASIPEDAAASGVSGTLSERVQETIRDYDLTRYDEPLSYEPVNTLTVPIWNEAIGAYEDQVVTLADLADEATSHLGVPYVWGGTTPAGFDCSGLVQYAYAHAIERAIPRTSYYQCTIGQDVDFADLHTGDLLFFERDGVVGHVAMYLGEGCYIEAPQTGMEVKITAMDEKSPSFAKRVIATVPVQIQEAEEPISDEGLAESATIQEAQKIAACEQASSTYRAWRQQLDSYHH